MEGGASVNLPPQTQLSRDNINSQLFLIYTECNNNIWRPTNTNSQLSKLTDKQKEVLGEQIDDLKSTPICPECPRSQFVNSPSEPNKSKFRYVPFFVKDELQQHQKQFNNMIEFLKGVIKEFEYITSRIDTTENKEPIIANLTQLLDCETDKEFASVINNYNFDLQALKIPYGLHGKICGIIREMDLHLFLCQIKFIRYLIRYY